MNKIEVYAPPDKMADFTIRNLGSGEVAIHTAMDNVPIQGGEAKRVLFLMSRALDRVAADWDVPNDLNKQGVERKQITRKIKI